VTFLLGDILRTRVIIILWNHSRRWGRCRYQQDGIRVPAGRDCQVVPGKHGPLRCRMILECHRALTGMPPFLLAMEEGRYGLWRLRTNDDDDDDDSRGFVCKVK